MAIYAWHTSLTCLMVVFMVCLVGGQQRTKCPIDLSFVIDSSGSICDNDKTRTSVRVDGKSRTTCDNWKLVLSFAASIVDKLEVGDDSTLVSAVRFSNRATLLFDFKEYDDNQDIQDTLQAVIYTGGNTNTSGGLRVTRESVYTVSAGDRSDVINVAVIIADGKSTRDQNLTIPEAKSLREDKDVSVYVVGVTDQIDEAELRAISSHPQQEGQNYFKQASFQQLDVIVEKLVDLACAHGPEPDTTTTTTRRPPSTTRSTRPTSRTTGECIEVDVVFVVDSSGSIREANFQHIRQFLSDLVGDLNIDSGRVRVGLLQFSTSVEERFSLGERKSRSDLEDELSSLPYTRGTTNTAAALDYLVDTMFTSGKGDRGDVLNMAVVMTDGNSNHKESTVEAAERVKSGGAYVIAVQMGTNVNQGELKSIASYPWTRNVLKAERFDKLDEIKTNLTQYICNDEDECSSNPCQNGGTCRDGIAFYTCLCRDRWGGRHCQIRCREPADVLFSLDTSGSIKNDNFERIMLFAEAVATDLPIDGDARVALQTFANDAKIYFHLNSHNDRLTIMNALGMPYYMGGTTNAADALRSMREFIFISSRGDRDNYPNVVVTVTDGSHTADDEDAAWREAGLNRRQDIHMTTVGVGGNVRIDYLQNISSMPVENNVFTISSFRRLHELVDDIRDTICNNVDECASDPCTEGGRCVDERNGYYCECKEGYTGKLCQRQCTIQADIVFVIDKSGSIGHDRFLIVKEFFVSILEELDLQEDQVRVGVVSFATYADIEFYLNSHDSKEDIIQNMQHIHYTRGRSNIAHGLQRAREEVFQSAAGDRENVPNYLVLFTDGEANEQQEDTVNQAIQTRIDGIHIVTLGVGHSVNNRELGAIASYPPTRNSLAVSGFTNMHDVTEDLLNIFCDIDDCEGSECDRGSCVDVINDYRCNCPEGWTGRYCDRRCDDTVDLVFILDRSGSLDDGHDLMVELVQKMVYGLDLGSGQSRVAVITYSTAARVHFYLDTYSGQQDVLNGLSFRESGGRTNTQAALNLARTEVFDSRRGDRSGVENRVVLMTDGGSNIDPRNTIPEAKALRDDDVDIFVIGIGNRIDEDEVSSIASRSSSPYVTRLDSSRQVDQIVDGILDELC